MIDARSGRALAVATIGLTGNRFSQKPIAAWVIDAGYQLAYLLIMAVVLTLWH